VLAFDPDDEMLALVDTLRPGIETGLLTNNGPVALDGVMRLLPQIGRRFDHLFFSCQLGAVKPERKVFEAVLKRIGRPADEVLFVDDSAANVEAASALGIQAIQFRSRDALLTDLKRLGLPAS
jgi:HAD superfamily hydrolase (TIGR01509 family)